jgi:hypothetical protein
MEKVAKTESDGIIATAQQAGREVNGSTREGWPSGLWRRS